MAQADDGPCEVYPARCDEIGGTNELEIDYSHT